MAAALAVAGCGRAAEAPDAPAPRWLYPPGAAPLGLGELRGRFGRSQAPQLGSLAGIEGPEVGRGSGGRAVPLAPLAPLAPLRLATPFPVPGPGPARAVLYGLEGDSPAIELVEIDAGRVAWRSRECGGLVVGVTPDVALCTDGTRVAAVGLDGARRWARDGTFLALTEDRVALAGDRGVLVLDAADGEELAHLALPRGALAEEVVATCGDAGRELYLSDRAAQLVRVSDGRAGAVVRWATPVGALLALDACTGPTLLARARTETASALLAIDRETGAITGRVDGVLGTWPARGAIDRVEVTTAQGVLRWRRDLRGAPELLALPALGELIAERGDARLVRATEHTAVLLDGAGVRAHLLFAWQGGAIGDTALLGASWTGAAGETAHRVGLPPRERRALRLVARAPVPAPAQLLDLPPAAAPGSAAVIAAPPAPGTSAVGVGAHAVAAAALDPDEPTAVYAVTLEEPPTDGRPVGLARADVAARAWRWWRGDGCGTGTPVGVAATGGVVACAARTAAPRAATVTATGADGARRWRWAGEHIDGIEAAGGAIALRDADRLLVLDAATGELRARLASDDGAPLRAALVAVGRATYLVTYERGRLVARLPGGRALPVWSLQVDGVVRAIVPAGDAAVVELDDGDAYRVDVRTAAVTPLAGIGLAWRAAAGVILGSAPGGPIPGEWMAPPAPGAAARGARAGAPPQRPVPAPSLRARASTGLPDGDEPPRLWVPIAPLPPRGASYHLALYELAGGLRARSEYPLDPPIAGPIGGGPPGSPVVLAWGPELRDALALDPRTGAPLRRAQLPEDGASDRVVFGTVVGGAPVAGALVAQPLRLVLF